MVVQLYVCSTWRLTPLLANTLFIHLVKVFFCTAILCSCSSRTRPSPSSSSSILEPRRDQCSRLNRRHDLTVFVVSGKWSLPVCGAVVLVDQVIVSFTTGGRCQVQFSLLFAGLNTSRKLILILTGNWNCSLWSVMLTSYYLLLSYITVQLFIQSSFSSLVLSGSMKSTWVVRIQLCEGITASCNSQSDLRLASATLYPTRALMTEQNLEIISEATTAE